MVVNPPWHRTIEKAGKVDKEAMIDALAGLVIKSPDRAVDGRQESSRHHEHVPGQDQGTRPRHGACARSDRAGPWMQMT